MTANYNRLLFVLRNGHVPKSPNISFCPLCGKRKNLDSVICKVCKRQYAGVVLLNALRFDFPLSYIGRKMEYYTKLRVSNQ